MILLVEVKALIRLCRYAGWSGSLLSVHDWGHVFAWHSLHIKDIIININVTCHSEKQLLGTSELTSLCVYTFQLGSLLFCNIIYNIQWLCKWTGKILRWLHWTITLTFKPWISPSILCLSLSQLVCVFSSSYCNLKADLFPIREFYHSKNSSLTLVMVN